MWANRGQSSQSRSDKNDVYTFEQQNDVRMEELGSKISALKNITIDMHQDVTDQERLLDESHSAFGGLGSTLGKSFGRMNRVISKRHQRQLCFYVGITVILFFILYWGSSLVGSSDPAPNPDGGQSEPEM